MTFYTNYYAEITHPVTEQLVESRLSFEHIPYFKGNFDEPPDYGGVDMQEVVVFGKDIINLFSPEQMSNLGDEVLGDGLDDFWEPDCFDSDDEEF